MTTDEFITDRLALRNVLGAFATGVTVLTVGGGHARGMTANSFTAVSLDPPLVLACVSRAAIMHAGVLHEQSFAVSVLAAGQERIARHFADRRRAPGIAQFRDIDWTPGRYTGAPLIGGALAWFECRLNDAHDGGDHSIFVGRLLSATRGPEGQCTDPLVFHGGRFHRLP